MSEHTIQCWSCGTSATLNEIRTADGYCPECDVEIDLAEYYPKLAEAHDALHAEAEELRAENGRLNAELSGALTGIATESQAADHYRTQMEAARGLLRELIGAVRTINHGPQHKIMVKGDDQPSYWQRQEWVVYLLRMCNEAEAALTATPAPEAQAEHGDRQEASGYACAHCGEFAGKPAPYKAHVECSECGKLTAATCAAARGFAKQYTTPQPGPDVRGLVEALEWYEQQAAGCRKLTSEGDECRQSLDSDGGKRAQTVLAIHRQAQKGDSNDT